MKIHIPTWEEAWKRYGGSREETAKLYRDAMAAEPHGEAHTPWLTPNLDKQDHVDSALSGREAA